MIIPQYFGAMETVEVDGYKLDAGIAFVFYKFSYLLFYVIVIAKPRSGFTVTHEPRSSSTILVFSSNRTAVYLHNNIQDQAVISSANSTLHFRKL